MQNKLQSGRLITTTAPYAVAGGALVVNGSLVGVACDAAEISATVVIDTEGVFTLAKTSAEAYDVGDPLYFNPSTKVLTSDADDGDNTLVAVAVQAAANPSSTCVARLIGAGLTGAMITAMQAA
jgi:predicted RecA/RadA family phage recombinase